MRSVLVVLAMLFVVPCSAQDLGGIKVPDLSAYDVSASAPANAAAAKPESDQPSKVDRLLFRSSQGSQVGAAILDDVTTGWGMTHPLVASYCLEGVPVCTHSVTNTITWHEAGWAAGFVDHNSPAKTVATLVAVDAAVFLASRALYNHGGVWRKIGIGLNFIQAAGHLQGGIRNLRSRASQARGLVPSDAFNVVR